jgi:hypothetical protein
VAVSNLAIDMYSKDTPVTISPNQDSRPAASLMRGYEAGGASELNNQAHVCLAPAADLSPDCSKPSCRLKAARLKRALRLSCRRHHYCRHTIAYALLQ